MADLGRKKKLGIKVVCDVIFSDNICTKMQAILKEVETNNFYSHNFDALGRNRIKYDKQYISDNHACSP